MLSGWYQSRHPVFPDSQFGNDRNLHSQSLNPSFNQTMKAFYLSLIFTLTLMLFSSCGEKPGQQNIDPIPESKPVSSSLDPIDRQPPTSPPTHGIVSRNGLYYKGSSETPFTGKYEEVSHGPQSIFLMDKKTVSKKPGQRLEPFFLMPTFQEVSVMEQPSLGTKPANL
jgi:hypothetical protein